MPARLRCATLGLLALLGQVHGIEADPPPAPTTHASVQGHVLREDGTPVAGVQVRLVVGRRWSSRSELVSTSMADGGYRFDAAPAGDALVYVADGGLVSRGLADVLADDAGPSARTLRAAETARIDVIVIPGASLKGRVARAVGSPLGTLRVEAVPSRSERSDPTFVPPSAAAEAAADGTFALVGLVPGLAYDVRVLPHGAPPVERARVMAGVEQDAITLALPVHRAVVLTVLGRGENDQPIAGAGVRLRHADPPGRSPGGEARTDAAGHARVFVPEGAKAMVAVEAAGWIASAPELLPPGDRSTIRLARPQRIHGKVLHPDGRPAAGVQVGVAWDEDAPETVTGDDGRFVLEGLSPEPLALVAGSSADGKHGVRAMRHVVPDGTEVVLHLEPFGDPEAPRLRVRLLDSEGRVVPRARVALRTPQGMTMWGAAEAGEETFVLGEDDADQRLVGASVVAWGAETEDGRPLPLGPAVVGPVAEGQAEVVVRLPPERVREGRVHGPGGEPVVGARVYVRAAVQEGSPLELATEDYTVRTDAVGRFTARGLPDADLVLHVAVPRPYTAPAAVPVPRGTAPIAVEVASGASVEVTVLDPAGKPVAGAEVRAWFPPPAKPGPEVVAKTDERGVARLARLDSTRRPALRVDGPSPSPRWEQAEWTPAHTTVRLEAGGTLGGIVRGPNGVPLERVFVQHDDRSTETWNRSQLTGRDGRFDFDRLRAGAITLSAVLDDCMAENEAGPDPVTRCVVRAEVGARDLDIRLDPGRTLDVLPPEGTPPNTRLEMRCRRGDRLFRRQRQTTRGESVRVNGLSADDSVVVYLPADADGRAALRVAGPGQSPVRLERTVTGTLRGRVVLPPGAAQAHVYASEESLDIGLDAHTDAEGRYEIRGVPETWTWTVSADVRVHGVGWVGEVAHVRRGEVPDLSLTRSP